MAITEEAAIDKIEIVSAMGGWWNVQIRTRTTIKKDDVIIASSFHRRGIAPDGDWSSENSATKAVCDSYHTNSAKTAYASHMASK